MSTLEFISKLVDSLVWPLTLIVAVALLRAPLSQLLPQVRKLRYKDFEADFGDDMDALKEQAHDVLPIDAHPAAQNESGADLAGMTRISPSSAVLQAWKEVEASARELIESAGIVVDGDVATPYRVIGAVLEKEALCDRKTLKVFHDLRRLRNKVAHAEDYEISAGRSGDYVDLALTLAARFRELAQETRPEPVPQLN